MELFTVMFRTLFFYFFIMFAYRLMGKREIGQLGVIDLIVSILIAELVAISIENANDPMILTILPIALLVIIEVIFGYLSIKFRSFRNVLDGKPSIIINHGIVNYKELVKQRYSLDDLLLSLRQEGIKSIDEVEYAFLEINGKLSVFKYNFLKTDSAIPLPLIVDGIIQENTLKEIKKSKLWVKIYLKNQNIKLEDVFYGFYKNKKIYLIKKNDIK